MEAAYVRMAHYREEVNAHLQSAARRQEEAVDLLTADDLTEHERTTGAHRETEASLWQISANRRRETAIDHAHDIAAEAMQGAQPNASRYASKPANPVMVSFQEAEKADLTMQLGKQLQDKGSAGGLLSIRSAIQGLVSKTSSVTALTASQRSRRKHRGRSKARRKFWTWLDSKLPIILPTDWRRRYWDLMILAFVVYNAVSVPFEASFVINKSLVQNMLENIIDVLFAVDLLSNFRTAYINPSGHLIRDGGKITKHYLRTWFPIDLLSSLPFDYIVLLFGIKANSSNLTLLSFLKTPRLLRLGRLLRFLEKIKNANVFRIVRLMLLMCLIAHWIGCLWHFLLKFYPDLEWSIAVDNGVVDAYLQVFYGAFLLMVGDNVGPLNNVERIFCCVTLVIGACFYATVVGNMALLVSNLNATAARHQQRQEVIQDAMRYLNVPSDIQGRVQEYYDYLSTYAHPGPELMSFLADLPPSMFKDMTTQLYKHSLWKIDILAGTEEVFLQALCGRLRLTVALAGETVYRRGDYGEEMYFIHKGKVSIVADTGIIEQLLHAGDHFGEVALLSSRIRDADAVSLTNSDLMSVRASDLALCMRNHPSSGALVREAILSRVKSHEAKQHPSASEQAGRNVASGDSDIQALSLHLYKSETVGAPGKELSAEAVAPEHQSSVVAELDRPRSDTVNATATPSLQHLEAMIALMIAKIDVVEMNQHSMQRKLQIIQGESAASIVDDGGDSEQLKQLRQVLHSDIDEKLKQLKAMQTARGFAAALQGRVAAKRTAPAAGTNE